ncbi:MAG: DUF3857 domain-containing protein [Deltaproteobacteria bacterium]|nr:DUF3857 domain-containing protein [Deltaproteobacteria bacterium]
MPIKLSLSLILVLLSTLGCQTAPPKSTAFDWSEGARKALRTEKRLDGKTLAQRGWLHLVEGALLPARQDLVAAGEDSGLKANLRRRAWLGAGFADLALADFEAAASSFCHGLQSAPARGPDAHMAAQQLAEVLHQLPNGHQAYAARLQKLLNAKESDADSRRALRVILMEAALRQGNLPKAKEHRKALGSPGVWQMKGPCGRHAGLAFQSIHGPETSQDKDACGHAPRTVWSPSLNLDLEAYPHAGVFFVQSWFRLESPKKLRLRISSEGPWSLSMNGQALHQHDRHLQNLPRVQRLAVGLTAGWHQIQLKLPLEKKASLGLEVTTADGHPAPISWWDGMSEPPASKEGGLLSHELLPSPALARQGEAADQSADPVTPWLAGLLLWEEGLSGKGRRLMDEALRRAPGFALADYMGALMVLADRDVPSGIDSILAREAFSRAVKNSPDFALARFRLALLQAEQGQEEKALAILDALDAKRPQSFLWPLFRSRIEGKLGWAQRSQASLLKARQRLPDHPIILLRAFEQARQRQSLALSESLAKEMAGLGQAPEALADFWVERGKRKQAESTLRSLLDRKPDHRPALLGLAHLATQIGQPIEAQKLMEAAQTIKPGALDAGLMKAEMLDAEGRTSASNDLRKRLSIQAPWHLSLQKQLAALTLGQVQLLGEKPVDTKKLIKAYRDSGFAPKGDAILVLDQAATQVAEDGSSMQHVHLIAHILTSDGLERWGELNLVPEKAWVEGVRTIHANGQTLEAERHPNKESISLPGLQVGDFVELSYLMPQRASSPMARSFLGKRFYFRSIDTPIFRSVFTLAAPKSVHVDLGSFHGAPRAQRTQQGDHQIWRLVSEKALGLEKEAQAPPLDDHSPFVQFGFGMSWTDYRNILALELLESQRGTAELDDYLAEVFKGLEPDAKETQKLRRLYHRVLADIQTNGLGDRLTQPASHILARREGNRLVLLNALLHRLGYRPQVLLARTITDPQVSHPLPLGGVFTHGLLKVPLLAGKGSIWMDPAARHHPFDHLFDFLAGMRALDLSAAPDGPVWTKLPGRIGTRGSKHIDMSLHLEADGTIHGRGTEKLSSSQAVHYRRVLNNMSPTLRRQVLEAGLGQTFSGARLLDFEIKGLDQPDRALLISYNFRAPAFARHSPDGLIIRGGFFAYQLSSNLISKAVRSTSLVMGDSTRTHTRVRIALPPGAKLKEAKRSRLTAPLGDFAYRLDQQGGVLELDKHLEVEAGRVQPKDYARFKKFCREVDDLDTEAIQIVLPPMITGP